jgi:hypothetical protein
MHELGQRVGFPDYPNLLVKFTGPLKPYYLQRLYRDLRSKGLDRYIDAYVWASEHSQLVHYKAQFEAALRSADYGGYQMLQLSDITGQEVATVGFLDPFWEQKGPVTAEDIRPWNAPVVPLARFNSYTWTTEQTLGATLQVAHYGETDLIDRFASWSLREKDTGRITSEGEIEVNGVAAGGLENIGSIQVSLSSVPAPQQLELTVSIGGYANRWPLWVYPMSEEGSEGVEGRSLLITSMSESSPERIARVLARGGTVLVQTAGLKNQYVNPSGFEQVFWSAGWWGDRFSHLGGLCDPKHPALAHFPTERFTDWQWESVMDGCALHDLTEWEPVDPATIVQAVSDFHYNRFLAFVFECRVGVGSLLVCGFDLETDLENRIAAKQFRRSIESYVTSDAFNPGWKISERDLRALLSDSA